MPLKLFITGTDTGIGKTHISVSLLKHFNQQGLSTLGIKPLASGATWHNECLRNEDALALQNAASIKLPYEIINPLVFAAPIAPHIAAEQTGACLTVSALLQKCQPALHYPAQVTIIEGVGGWYMPLNQRETMADFVNQANLTVLLVVGIRLGCLNHALLTYEALKKSGVKVMGWVANCIDPSMLALQENITTLQQWLPIPCVSVVPYNTEPVFFTMVTSPAENA